MIEAWQRRIQEGQRDALRRYGHLSGDELRELGRKGKLSRPVVEFLVAARAGSEAERIEAQG